MGRKLVKELELEPGVDTLGRWMAHHLAELILRGEQADGPEAEAARRECVDTILALWRHRAALPGRRPLLSFEPIFRVLAALSELREPWYLRDEREREGEVADWLDVARVVDRAARGLIRWCVANAATAAGEAEADWLAAAAPLAAHASHELLAIRMMLDDTRTTDGVEEGSPGAGGDPEAELLLAHLDALEGALSDMRQTLREAANDRPDE